MKNGVTDIPAEKDQFEIKNYIDGLVKFIGNCNTPMTLAIQGDWGTGKTSIMRMVCNQLDSDKVHSIWFNTWQFSQFNMGEQLPLLMMSKLISAVSDKNTEAIATVKKLLFGMAGLTISGITGGGAGSADIKEMVSADFVKEIDSLKESFDKLIEEKAGDDGRVVVFIDDLDRLQPGKAVELLEVLKVFLDCNKCVFVLAIDYGVVCRGVKEKYGQDFSDEKGKSFFDKIIQVPFKMPVAEYNTINYIKEGFHEIGIEVDPVNLPIFEALIRSSIGNNPRGMKRLFNSFLLLKYVADESIFNDAHKTAILFSLLCMQSRYESVYNYLIAHRNQVSADMLHKLLGQDEKLIEEFNLSEQDKDDLTVFVVDFASVIDSNQDGNYNPTEIEEFKMVLMFSAITANNAKESSNDFSDYRDPHKDRARRLRDKLNELYADRGIVFKDWYNIKDKGTWWVYFRNDKDGANPKFGYEFRFDPFMAATGKKSALTVNLYSLDDKNAPLADALAVIGQDPYAEVLEQAGELDGKKNRIWYKNVYLFDTNDDSADKDILGIIVKTVDLLEQYINKDEGIQGE